MQRVAAGRLDADEGPQELGIGDDRDRDVGPLLAEQRLDLVALGDGDVAHVVTEAGELERPDRRGTGGSRTAKQRAARKSNNSRLLGHIPYRFILNLNQTHIAPWLTKRRHEG